MPGINVPGVVVTPKDRFNRLVIVAEGGRKYYSTELIECSAGDAVIIGQALDQDIAQDVRIDRQAMDSPIDVESFNAAGKLRATLACVIIPNRTY